MTRTLRTLALATIAFSIALAIYSISQSGYGFDGDTLTFTLSQQLRTTGTALGLALAIVALVATAQARRWKWFSIYLVLAIVTTYGPEVLMSAPLFSGFPTFFAPLFNDGVYLQWVVLSFCIPPVATALLVLGEDSSERLWHISPSPADEADDVEISPLQDKAV